METPSPDRPRREHRFGLVGHISIVALTFALGLGFFLFYYPSLIHKATPVTIISDSMSPAFSADWRIWIDTANLTPEVGDVATYHTEDGLLVTHRVTNIIASAEGIQYEFKGDANDFPDTAVDPSQIVGVMLPEFYPAPLRLLSIIRLLTVCLTLTATASVAIPRKVR